ncbi:golgin candidate, partial [Thalictrum thalictroides]
NNPKGQGMLASTIIPQAHSGVHDPLDADIKIPFGSMLLRGLTSSESDDDLETCYRASIVLSHILKGNIQCKERVMQVKLEAPVISFGTPEPLLHRVVKYLAVAASMKDKNGNHKTSTSSSSMYTQPIFLRLLVTWFADFPDAVLSFLDSRDHLTYLLELVSSSFETVFIRGLSAILLGEGVLFNKSYAFMVVDAISQKIGLTSYFLKFDEMQKSFPFLSAKALQQRKPLARSSAASMSEIEDLEENNLTSLKHDEDPVLMSVFDAPFVNLVRRLESEIRESIVDVYSHPKSKVAVRGSS